MPNRASARARCSSLRDKQPSPLGLAARFGVLPAPQR
jgi:hypothetical protein